MVEYSTHAKTKWLIRGDETRRLQDAWEHGIEVECPYQSYDRARLDTDSETILLMGDGAIQTVLRAFGGTVYRLKFPVVCFDCGQHHHSPDTCPQCGSTLWSCR